MAYITSSVTVITTPSTTMNLTRMQRLLLRWEVLAREHQVDLVSDPIINSPVVTQSLAPRLRRHERKAVQR